MSGNQYGRNERKGSLSWRSVRWRETIFRACPLIALVASGVGVGLHSRGDVAAAETAARPDAPLTYEQHIRPLLQARCVRCHNDEARKADLDLSTPPGLLRGGESGPAVVPGKPQDSLLLEMIEGGSMPPDDQRQLDPEQVEAIRRWIAAGSLFADTDVGQLAAAGEVSNQLIEPLWQRRCAACHGLRVREANLDLRTKASMLRGGKSGAAMVPGRPDASLILARIHQGEMPPRDRLIQAGVKPMTPDEEQLLTRWIELGAPEIKVAPDIASDEPDPLVKDEERQFWSFQPPRRPPIPGVQQPHLVRNPIDAFVLAKLEERGLALSAQADPLVLLRRACYDLTGLPPAPHQIEEYLSDTRPDAYERMIERLLESPRYGERWGRIWLDAAGYADSEGKRSADPMRPYAYKYRDYVIRSLNADKPYDRFLLEQIAGDELADYEHASPMTQELIDNLVATGFLRMAPDGTGSDIVNFVPERLEVVADEMDVFGSTVLGLTIKCARCHSHKYDPIPQRDYYRLVAIFKGAYDEHDWLKPAFVAGQTKAQKPGRVLPYATPEETGEFAEQNERIDGEISGFRAKLDELAREIRQKHLDEQLARFPSALHEDLRRMLATPPGERGEVQRYLADRFEDVLQLDDAELAKLPQYSRAAAETNRTIKSLESEKNDGPQIRALWDRGEPSPTYIYRRGDYTQPGRLVGPGVPSVLTDGKTPFDYQPPWPGARQTGRRLALARWLVAPDHPLTSRVMVNRIWKHHFGEGIVRSLDNFGKLGTPPSHPELLDWLATKFVAEGWSIKALHRLIMTSATYRQTSAVSDEQQLRDPDNVWLSRMPLRRLDAEQLRDALLQVAGQLDERPYGRPDAVDVRADGLVTSLGEQGSRRRSIYVRQRRKETASILETFDLPQMNPHCQQRTDSTVAQQALYLLNNSAVREMARYLAAGVANHTADPSGRIERAFLIALSRPPTDQEREIALRSLLDLSEQWARHSREANQPGDDAPQQALEVFCHTVLNSASFLYID